MIPIQESEGRGSKSTAHEKAKRHISTHDNFSISRRSFLFLFYSGKALAFGKGRWYGSLVSFSALPFMNRFSLLESLLSPEQVSALRAVQSGLERDPTCLDRVSTETVPNCYTEESSSSELINNEETNNA